MAPRALRDYASLMSNLMKRVMLGLAAGVAAVSVGVAQQPAFDRLSLDRLDVLPPSERVSGTPGEMAIRTTMCRDLPLNEVRRRIVDVAAQEWGFFGFTVVDQTREQLTRGGTTTRRRWRRLRSRPA